MRWVACLTALLTWAAPAAEAAPREGTLIIHGGGRMTREVFRQMRELTGEGGTLVVIPTAKGGVIDSDAIVDRWRKAGFASVEVVHSRSRATANDRAFVEPLTRATAVWIEGGDQSRLERVYLGTRVQTELQALLGRGGVIGGTSAGAAIMSRVMIRYGDRTPRMGTGFGLLAGAIIDQHFVARARKHRLQIALRRHPRLIGLGIDEGTALVVRGEQVRVIGQSTVTLCLPARRGQPWRFIELAAGDAVDLAAVRAGT